MRFYLPTSLRSTLYAAIATLAHWLTFFLLVELGVTPSIATLVGATIGALLNYLLQFYVVFSSASTHKRSATRYTLLLMLNIPINTLLFMMLSQVLWKNIFLTQLLTSAIVALGNLCFYQKVIFNERVN